MNRRKPTLQISQRKNWKSGKALLNSASSKTSKLPGIGLGLLGSYSDGSDAENEDVSDSRVNPAHSTLDSKVADFLKEIDDIEVQAKSASDAKVKTSNNEASTKPEQKVDEPTKEIEWGQWQQCIDENTNHPYFWNVETNEVTWTLPDEISVQLTEDNVVEKTSTQQNKDEEIVTSKHKSEDGDHQAGSIRKRQKVKVNNDIRERKLSDMDDIDAALEDALHTTTNYKLKRKSPEPVQSNIEREKAVDRSDNENSESDGEVDWSKYDVTVATDQESDMEESSRSVADEMSNQSDDTAEDLPALSEGLSDKHIPAATKIEAAAASVEAALVKKQVGLVNKKEVPVIKKEIPFVKDEASAVKKEVWAVKKEIPATKKEIPAINKEIPAIKKEVPVIKKEVPVIKNEVPAIKKASVGKKEIPAIKKEVSAIKKEVSAVRKEVEPAKSVSVVGNYASDSSDELSEGEISETSSADEKPLPKKPFDLKETIESLSTVILSKLSFLEISKTTISDFHTLLLEVEVRLEDWKAGQLSDQYAAEKLELAQNQLTKYEQTAVPSGWTCQWNSNYQRYYYQNVTSGAAQWQYPIEDASTSDNPTCSPSIFPFEHETPDAAPPVAKVKKAAAGAGGEKPKKKVKAKASGATKKSSEAKPAAKIRPTSEPAATTPQQQPTTTYSHPHPPKPTVAANYYHPQWNASAYPIHYPPPPPPSSSFYPPSTDTPPPPGEDDGPPVPPPPLPAQPPPPPPPEEEEPIEPPPHPIIDFGITDGMEMDISDAEDDERRAEERKVAAPTEQRSDDVEDQERKTDSPLVVEPQPVSKKKKEIKSGPVEYSAAPVTIRAAPTVLSAPAVPASATILLPADPPATADNNTAAALGKVKPVKKTKKVKKTTKKAPKEMSGMVAKWQAAKHEIEKEEQRLIRESEDELHRESDARIMFEKWRQEQILSGKAATNANLTPVSDDWKRRVKLKKRVT